MNTVLIMCFSKSGSGPAFTLNLAKGFHKSGCRVYCIISNSMVNIHEWQEEDNFRVLALDTGTRKTIVKKTCGLFLNKKRIVNFLDKEIDISIQTFVHPWMQVINHWVNPKHEMAILHDPCSHSGESKLTAALAFIQYKLAKEIIVLTKEFIPIVSKKYKKALSDIYFIRHGIFDSYRDYSYETNEYNYLKDGINFLFFGRIEEYKGISVLLNSYSSLVNCYSNISLTIAGSGDISKYRDIMDQLPNLNVINRYIDDKEIKSIFTGSNMVLVLPYLDATQSGVVPIAIDFEVPVIASDSGGLKEQLDDGNIGLFVIPGDVDSLTNKMREFVENIQQIDAQKRLEREFKHELLWDNITMKLLSEIEGREHAKL